MSVFPEAKNIALGNMAGLTFPFTAEDAFIDRDGSEVLLLQNGNLCLKHYFVLEETQGHESIDAVLLLDKMIKEEYSSRERYALVLLKNRLMEISKHAKRVDDPRLNLLIESMNIHSK